jgi:integrase
MPHKHLRNGKWTGQWLGQVKYQGRRLRKLYDTKKAAQAWEAEMQRRIHGEEVAMPAPVPTVMVSLREWAERYLDYALRYSAKTYSEKRSSFRRLLRAFGSETPVETLKPGAVLAYVQRIFQERSGHAANKERKNLGAAWNYGCRYIEGFPTVNPFVALEKFPETAHARYVPSEQDFWKVVAVAQGQDRALLLTFLYTAARRGELYRLRWADVDFDRQCLRLTTKKRQHGSLEADWLPMTDALVEALTAHRHASTSEWVFTQTAGRHQGTPYRENRRFPRELCLQAGVTPFGCHAIRHLTGSILGNNNTPTVQIQQLLRHRRLATTERYIRALQPLRPYLKALEGGVSTKRSNNGSNTNEKGLRAITS